MWKRYRRMLGLLLMLASLVVYASGVDVVTKYQEQQKLYKYRVTEEIYKNLVAATGQIQNALPLEIVESNIINAYTDGTKVVIYTGLIDSTRTWDEVALVLGHEIAHGMLQHVGKLSSNDPREVTVLEGNADKYGAFLMMKTGYDVCLGRQIFLRWTWESGNGLNQDHPPNIYRYYEINVRCGSV